ncbi:hypothetical protein [Solicola sp. PLA-1-18]|jgi:hypothetical protein|uniref:hypothetical protein n=1 Tax=Solicola sp. PLA-1-18 TaxID=3380532 RepID=UPI003B820928
MTPADPFSRRRVLAGLGAVLATPVALALPTPAAAAPSEPAPECLASLVQEGELAYGDLMAR